MNIQRLDHFTIRTEQWDETAAFFIEVVGLQTGPRPAFRFPGHWLYAGGKPILHIVAQTPERAELEAYLGSKATEHGSGSIDHISLRCQGLAEMQGHLVAQQISFRERVIPEVGEHQLFLEDPNGITVEMIFPYSRDDRIVGLAMPPLEVLEHWESDHE
ncbi:catechol 2,3-dioxygenase-like lactoylglutathione lyase family enzyme [Pseudomonas sp. TE3786]